MFEFVGSRSSSTQRGRGDKGAEAEASWSLSSSVSSSPISSLQYHLVLVHSSALSPPLPPLTLHRRPRQCMQLIHPYTPPISSQPPGPRLRSRARGISPPSKSLYLHSSFHPGCWISAPQSYKEPGVSSASRPTTARPHASLAGLLDTPDTPRHVDELICSQDRPA